MNKRKRKYGKHIRLFERFEIQVRRAENQKLRDLYLFVHLVAVNQPVHYSLGEHHSRSLYGFRVRHNRVNNGLRHVFEVVQLVLVVVENLPRLLPGFLRLVQYVRELPTAISLRASRFNGEACWYLYQ